jgi:hypothetical protein
MPLPSYFQLRPLRREERKIAFEWFPEFKAQRFATREEAEAANPNEADWQVIECHPVSLKEFPL